MIDLNPKYLEIIQHILAKHVPDCEVRAFGSRVTWTAKDYSDLDIAIVCEGKLEKRRLNRLQGDFEDQDLPIRVDVLDWHAISESFQQVILRQYEVIRAVASDSLIGRIPAHWDIVSLGQACQKGGGSIQTGPFGSQLHQSDYVEVGIPSIMPTNIGDNKIVADGIARITPQDAQRLSKYRVKAGDIVYSRRGDVERRALVREEEDGWLCGTGCLRVRFGSGSVDPVYASYYLGHPAVREWIVRHSVGATMRNLNTSILANLPFVRPPLDEQRAIAHILGTLDDKIELNRRMNQTLEAMARAIFKSWFVDFDPVRAKAEGRHPEGMDAATAALFPDSFQGSILGPIPTGWRGGFLEDVAHLNPESWTNRDPPEHVEYVDLSNTKWGTIESTQSFEWSNAPSRAQRVLRDGDTIVGTVRPGNGSFALIGVDGLTGSTGFAVLRPKAQRYRELIYLTVTDSENIARLAHLSDGAAYPAIRPDVVVSTVLPLPNDQIIDSFSRITAPLLNRIEASKLENQTLAQLRDTLLPKLMSGEVRVPDAERMVERQK